MAFTETQRGVLDAHLPLRYPDSSDAVAILEVTRRQLRFLLEAIDHFRATACPSEGKGDECALVVWAETGPTGSIERACYESCDRWLDSLVMEKIPAAFPRRSRFS